MLCTHQNVRRTAVSGPGFTAVVVRCNVTWWHVSRVGSVETMTVSSSSFTSRLYSVETFLFCTFYLVFFSLLSSVTPFYTRAPCITYVVNVNFTEWGSRPLRIHLPYYVRGRLVGPLSSRWETFSVYYKNTAITRVWSTAICHLGHYGMYQYCTNTTRRRWTDLLAVKTIIIDWMLHLILKLDINLTQQKIILSLRFK